jgi:Tfp pilus assembly protein PilO
MVIVLAAFVWFLGFNTIRPFLTARKDLQAFRRGVQILSDAEGSVVRLDAEIQRITEEIAATEAILPQDLNLDAFLQHLGDLGHGTGIRVERLIPHDFVEHRLFRELVVEVYVTGPFLAVYDFLTKLEREGQLSRVEQLMVNQRETDGHCGAEIRLALYFSPEKEA